MTRRRFLGTAAALAATKGLAAEPAPALRVGILSDTHCRNFEAGFRIFDAAEVDAVLITGDMFLFTTVKELEDVAAAWSRVFPGDKRSDGAKVERLFVTGNHDEIDWCRPFKSWEDLQARSMRFNREAAWKRLFGEDYEKVRIREVKGYTFVLRHWLCRGRTEFGHKIPVEEDPVPAFMAARAYDFSVRCEALEGDLFRTVCESRVFSPHFAMAERWDRDGASSLFPAAAIPSGRRGHVRFVVTPYDCWGNAGPSIASGWMSEIPGTRSVARV